MRARRWLHRHVWTRTGWRWAYSPSTHMADMSRLGTPSFALLVQGELGPLQEALNKSLANLEKATRYHALRANMHTTEARQVWPYVERRKPSTEDLATNSISYHIHNPQRLTMGLVELGHAGMVLPVGDHACPDTSCRKCWEPAPW